MENEPTIEEQRLDLWNKVERTDPIHTKKPNSEGIGLLLLTLNIR